MAGSTARVFLAVLAAVLTASAAGVIAPVTASEREPGRHVLLLSVDGLHQSDLTWYVHQHPNSALASLVRKGVEFTQARTPVPSDSFPGLVGPLTGGNPSSTGVYYDDSFNRALFPAGTTKCTGPAPGAEVTYFEAADKNPHALDAGQGLAGVPGSILQMTGNPATLIDPAQLPVDPATCKPIYPHSYIKVNTVFEVVRAAGLRTAWTDKHPAYEILNGPSGTGVQDLFTPEINSDAPVAGSPIDWTADNALTQQYDSYKVQSVINEIRGFDHSGTRRVGTPAIFGMNFQTVSTAEKLPTSNGLTGGYLADGVTPGPLLTRALEYINRQVGAMRAAIDLRELGESTVMILSAKHGQSPQTPSALTRIPDSPIIDALNAAWKAAHPTAVQPLVAFSIDDDGMLMWLNDRSATATNFAKDFLLNHSGTGNDINGNPKPYTSSGLARIYAGAAAAAYFHVARSDSRAPDIFGISQYGTVFTGSMKKIAEHGGANIQDRHVPLVVSGGPIEGHAVRGGQVETTQIAPTILSILGLDPSALKAVRIEHTATLPLSEGDAGPSE
ncbi:alkaline phosphatase family protein [Candidatus Nephthysia bennettiae]|uniref:Alkaline phosphatase family protein n=1 Tax=Candidatus Nephthysia bennettiae TaxID=3127016 RepID=A0A934NA15_9BACT|nr:alkaline phosphatase family protein [Candidatus Dormibacteraeota bacterium]MBJ7611657.1 alkaline phosphatase family protein [Candidatus Dormibacteraeota bacterium]